jgi:phenylacetate-CoA ligase
MPNWYKVYDHLPHPLRVLAANVRGFYLRWWRYGPETKKLIEEALERETWNLEQWKTWQEERLSCVLHRAATKIPYYREYWVQQRQRGNQASWSVLENWPILKKEILRENPLAFVADDCDARRMFCDRTSGTTGTPLSIYFRRNILRQYYALFEARLRRWHGISQGERWAIMGGQPIIPFHRKDPPFWIFNRALNQLYLSTYHLTGENVKWYVDALCRYAPTHMIVYPSSASILAATILDKAFEIPKMKGIFSNAELLLEEHKKIISEAFRCPVYNTYGMGEMVGAASECEEGGFHIWPEVGVIEVIDDIRDVSVKNGSAGRLILTGLLNEDMPLIRYEVGDRGSLMSPEVKCACGKSLHLLYGVEGRQNDMILTADGRRIFWLNPIFYGLPILEAQIIQETTDKVRVRYVPNSGFTPKAGDLIIERLRARIGMMEVILEQVDKMPRGPNGKFRPVISHLQHGNVNRKE